MHSRGLKPVVRCCYWKYASCSWANSSGVLELELHNAALFERSEFFDHTVRPLKVQHVLMARSNKRHVCAILAQEPRRFCLQEPGSPRNDIRGQGLWGERSFSKRLTWPKNQSVSSWLHPRSGDESPTTYNSSFSKR